MMNNKRQDSRDSRSQTDRGPIALQAEVEIKLPRRWDIFIYPSFERGKWAASCMSIITEPFDTPQDALAWGIKLAQPHFNEEEDATH